MVSGSLSPPFSGCFAPFPHGTSALSVTREYLALPGGTGSFTQGSPDPVLLRSTPATFLPSRTGLSPSTARLPSTLPLRILSSLHGVSYNPAVALRPLRFGLLPFRSPLLREYLLVSFPPGTEMFQFPGFASRKRGMLPLQGSGLPHSGIPGSQPVCGSPGLIAAYHALHRLRVPRHPPHTLTIVPFNHLPRTALTCQRPLLWRVADSNRRPPACKAGALAN